MVFVYGEGAGNTSTSTTTKVTPHTGWLSDAVDLHSEEGPLSCLQGFILEGSGMRAAFSVRLSGFIKVHQLTGTLSDNWPGLELTVEHWATSSSLP